MRTIPLITRKTVDELEEEAVLSEKIAETSPPRFMEIEMHGKKIPDDRKAIQKPDE